MLGLRIACYSASTISSFRECEISRFFLNLELELELEQMPQKPILLATACVLCVFGNGTDER